MTPPKPKHTYHNGYGYHCGYQTRVEPVAYDACPYCGRSWSGTGWLRVAGPPPMRSRPVKPVTAAAAALQARGGMTRSQHGMQPVGQNPRKLTVAQEWGAVATGKIVIDAPAASAQAVLQRLSRPAPKQAQEGSLETILDVEEPEDGSGDGSGS